MPAQANCRGTRRKMAGSPTLDFVARTVQDMIQAVRGQGCECRFKYGISADRPGCLSMTGMSDATVKRPRMANRPLVDARGTSSDPSPVSLDEFTAEL